MSSSIDKPPASFSFFIGVSNFNDLERGGRLTNLSGELVELSSGVIKLLLGGFNAGVADISLAGVDTNLAGVDIASTVLKDPSLLSAYSMVLLGVASCNSGWCEAV
ncbi:hypothetical protein MtrunA17_Chr1g0184211 [Medicago truncatula]|uniref:Uncharacterized protein n=1 Tax=Medicago truncatula TaxID=3880 RepID=A0A396JZZ0_MEDTR|nr:hypothetical protein MtrunA17_Chr1g0184211 [Medicago truncatula]